MSQALQTGTCIIPNGFRSDYPQAAWPIDSTRSPFSSIAIQVKSDWSCVTSGIAWLPWQPSHIPPFHSNPRFLPTPAPDQSIHLHNCCDCIHFSHLATDTSVRNFFHHQTVTAFIFPASRPTLASDAFFSPPVRSSFLTNQFIMSIVPPPCHAVIEYGDSYSPSLKMHEKLMKLRLLLPAFDRAGQTNGLLWGRRDQTQPSQPFLFFPR